MRFYLILSALAIVSVTATLDKRQDPITTAPEAGQGTSDAVGGSETSTTITDSGTSASGTPTTTLLSPSGSGTPASSSNQCSAVCSKAEAVYDDCHKKDNSLPCFCTATSVNALGDCAGCKERLGTSDAKTEASALKDQIGGIVAACSSAGSSVAAPTGVTITSTATISNSAQITPPPAAKITGGAGTGSNSSSSVRSGASSQPSGSTNNNGAGNAFVISGTLVALVGAGALAIFI
ncbi:hypothetical protein L218DRAFT_960325 [Marasmius fiardii PR-910]|nr:hypothetical protein L218DRAFT_960325 [Marasmius fiardii PR-910]